EPQALVFVHDVGKAVLVGIDGPETFIRVHGQAANPERPWVSGLGGGFTHVCERDDPDDAVWVHDASGIAVRVLLEERMNPVSAMDYELRQKHIVAELAKHTFRAVENAQSHVVETVRRLSDPRWYVLLSSAKHVFWA